MPNDNKTKTTISILVPSFNRAHYLNGALATLTRQETDGRFDYEVVVIDNASKDETRQVVEAFAATSTVPVRYLYESVPGDAPPRNKGISNTTSDWLAFFDDDQFAESRWLLNLLDTALKSETRIVGGPVHLDLDPQICSQLSDGCRSTLREMKPYDQDQPYAADVIPGTGNMMVHRSLFDDVGLFVVNIKEGGSDWKLVEDARAFGEIPWFSVKASIRHRVEQTRMTPAYFRWDSQNGGVSAADVDCRKLGLGGVVAKGAARLLRIAPRIPLLLADSIRPPKYGSSQSQMMWWRTAGYLRRTVTLLAPKVFPQKAFHEYVDFRTGRIVGT